MSKFLLEEAWEEETPCGLARIWAEGANPCYTAIWDQQPRQAAHTLGASGSSLDSWFLLSLHLPSLPYLAWAWQFISCLNRVKE